MAAQRTTFAEVLAGATRALPTEWPEAARLARATAALRVAMVQLFEAPAERIIVGTLCAHVSAHADAADDALDAFAASLRRRYARVTADVARAESEARVAVRAARAQADTLRAHWADAVTLMRNAAEWHVRDAGRHIVALGAHRFNRAICEQFVRTAELVPRADPDGHWRRSLAPVRAERERAAAVLAARDEDEIVRTLAAGAEHVRAD